MNKSRVIYLRENCGLLETLLLVRVVEGSVVGDGGTFGTLGTAGTESTELGDATLGVDFWVTGRPDPIVLEGTSECTGSEGFIGSTEL